MKKHKKTLISLGFIIFGLGSLEAQESLTAAGGEAISLGGTLSYSVGQIITTTDSNVSGSISTGVQQAYEIFLVTGINENSINLRTSVYPNPTTDFLKLEVESESLYGLTYELFDLSGKLVASQKVNDTQTSIDIESFSKATYLLRVVQNNQIIKTYRIIKH